MGNIGPVRVARKGMVFLPFWSKTEYGFYTLVLNSVCVHL